MLTPDPFPPAHAPAVCAEENGPAFHIPPIEFRNSSLLSQVGDFSMYREFLRQHVPTQGEPAITAEEIHAAAELARIQRIKQVRRIWGVKLLQSEKTIEELEKEGLQT